MYRAGMAVILSQLVRDERLLVVEELSVETPKTKEFSGKVQKMGLNGDVLFLTRELDEKVYLSSRNLPNVLVLETLEINPYSLLRFNKIVLTKDAVSHLEEQWV